MSSCGCLPQSATQFVVIHVRFRFPFAPSSGHLVRIGQFELSVRAFPRDAIGVAGVGQQLQ